jgi:hypothetical protein
MSVLKIGAMILLFVLGLGTAGARVQTTMHRQGAATY